MPCYLREVTKDDIPEINKWRNDREVIQYLGAPFRFINKETDESWFVLYNGSRQNAVRLAIVDSEGNALVGAVYLTSIDWIARSGEFSIWVGRKDYQSRGVGKFATVNMLSHAFHDLGLNRVHLTVLSINERARRLYRSVGFSEEGVHRQSVYKNGNFHDMIQMGILASEFSGFVE